MTTNFRALCVELADCLEKADWPPRYKVVFQQWTDIARAALAEPDGPAVPDGREPASVTAQPSDEQLLASVRHFYGDQTAADMGAEDDLRTARAVLAQFARPAAAPVPVSERLPGPEDCDGEGKVWAIAELNAWMRVHHNMISRWKAWLPANALPLP